MHARSVIFVVAILGVCAAFVAPAAGESRDACAQRVIRDWYSGGRVDRVYPLPCYRAAIRALPADVLQYSDADRDIARALAFARRGRTDPGSGKAAPATRATRTNRSPSEGGPAPAQPRPVPAPDARVDVPAAPRPASSAGGAPVRLASGPETPAAASGLPYPIVALALLAGILLSTAAVGWLASRARRR